MIVRVVPEWRLKVDQLPAEGPVTGSGSFSAARALRSCVPRFVTFLC